VIQVLHGDCRDTLKTIPAGTVQCCVTSPPYWGLRSYLTKGHASKHLEIGQEKTPEAYVETMVQVFREVRRCLHESGTLWLNIGDSYNGSGAGGGGNRKGNEHGQHDVMVEQGRPYADTLKPKDLCMIPWRVALALQQPWLRCNYCGVDNHATQWATFPNGRRICPHCGLSKGNKISETGWWLRSVICWHKKSCMPESVTDRPTNSWEPIFLLAKSQRYFYDAEAVKEPNTWPDHNRFGNKARLDGNGTGNMADDAPEFADRTGRNQRNVWTLGPEPYSEAHFATFPTEIPRRAILAGTSARGCCPKCFAPWERVVEKQFVSTRGNSVKAGHTGKHLDESNNWKNEGCGVNETRTVGWQPGCECYGLSKSLYPSIPCTVLDPFGGSGTTGAVTLELGRQAILCELNDAYLPLIQTRTNVTRGLNLA
jgi:DNA modification methylase